MVISVKPKPQVIFKGFHDWGDHVDIRKENDEKSLILLLRATLRQSIAR